MKILRGPNNEEIMAALDNMTPNDIFYKGFRDDDVELMKAGIERGFDMEGQFTKRVFDYFFKEEDGNFIFWFKERTKSYDFFLSNYSKVIQRAWDNMDIVQSFQASVRWDSISMFLALDEEISFIEACMDNEEHQHFEFGRTLLGEVLINRAFSIAYHLINKTKIDINEIDLEGNTALDIMLEGRNDSGFPNEEWFDPYDPECLKPALRDIGMISYLKSKGAKKASELDLD